VRFVLDADDASTIATIETGVVLQWRDKSGLASCGSDQRRRAACFDFFPLTSGRADVRRRIIWPVIRLAAGRNQLHDVFGLAKASTDGSQVIVEQAGPGNGARASLLAIDGGTYGFNGQNNDAHYLGTYSAGGWNLSGLEYNGLAVDNLYLDAAGGVTTATIDGTYTETVGVTAFQVGCRCVCG
jgi:hypothetical protein